MVAQWPQSALGSPTAHRPSDPLGQPVENKYQLSFLIRLATKDQPVHHQPPWIIKYWSFTSTEVVVFLNVCILCIMYILIRLCPTNLVFVSLNIFTDYDLRLMVIVNIILDGLCPLILLKIRMHNCYNK